MLTEGIQGKAETSSRRLDTEMEDGDTREDMGEQQLTTSTSTPLSVSQVFSHHRRRQRQRNIDLPLQCLK